MKKLSMLLAVVMLLSCCALAHAEEQTTISWTSWALAEEKLMPIYGGSADAPGAAGDDNGLHLIFFCSWSGGRNTAG